MNDDAERPDRMVLDELEFELTRVELFVTALPWGELELRMEAKGERSSEPMVCFARIEDYRVAGRERGDLEGRVLESGDGCVPVPGDSELIGATHTVHYGPIFIVVDNRVELRSIGDGRVRLLWTATTIKRVNPQRKGHPLGHLVLDVRVPMLDREYERLCWQRSEGLDSENPARAYEAPLELRRWLAVRGRELAAAGYFEGRPFARVAFVIEYRALLNRGPRMSLGPDYTLLVTIEAPIAVARVRPDELPTVLREIIDAALATVARAYPVALSPQA